MNAQRLEASLRDRDKALRDAESRIHDMQPMADRYEEATKMYMAMRKAHETAKMTGERYRMEAAQLLGER